MPDSMSINIMGRSLFPLVAVLEVGFKSMYTVRILNTIKPVTRALTDKDMARLVMVVSYTQLIIGVEEKMPPGIQRAYGQ